MNSEKKTYQALILVGGLGTRLHPYTEQVPKPMVEIEGRPFLEFKIESLRKHGIKDFILLVGHLGEKVEEHFGDGKRFGINIQYSYEKEKLLGTAGAIKNAEHLIKGDFIATNGDTFLDIDFEKLINLHETHDSPFTLTVAHATHPKTQELVEVKDDRIAAIYKRDTPEHENHLQTTNKPFVNAGCYIMSKEILNLIPPNQKISLEQEIFPQVTSKMHGFTHPGYMLDVADENDWNEFTKDVKQGIIAPSISGYKKIIRSRAPVRITFGGGGTDLNPYDKNHGGVCINATINKYVYSSLKIRDDRKINIKSDIINIHGGFESYSESFDRIDSINLDNDSKLNIIKAAILEMDPQYGFDLYVRSEVPPFSGLGASASLCVSVIGVLNHLRKKNRLTRHNIAETAFRIEENRLNNIGGRQDQYAAAFGGINLFEFLGNDNVRINSIEIPKEYLLEIEKNILLVSSGMKGKSSGEMHKEENEKKLYEDSEKIKRLHGIKETGLEVAFNLRRGNLKKFGNLIKESWEKKKKFNSEISSTYVDALIEEALNSGAIGARLMGAGGGGHLLIYCNPDEEHKVREVLNVRGAKAVDFSFDFSGLQVWEVEE
jgi:D-glycero-alpha-D-manno-heptose-7-phosphate kinase